MGKIKVRVKPGRALDTIEGGIEVKHTAGDEFLMDEDEAKPILGTCLTRVHKQKKKKSDPTPQPIIRPKKKDVPKKEVEPSNEKETV